MYRQKTSATTWLVLSTILPELSLVFNSIWHFKRVFSRIEKIIIIINFILPFGLEWIPDSIKHDNLRFLYFCLQSSYLPLHLPCTPPWFTSFLFHLLLKPALMISSFLSFLDSHTVFTICSVKVLWPLVDSVILRFHSCLSQFSLRILYFSISILPYCHSIYVFLSTCLPTFFSNSLLHTLASYSLFCHSFWLHILPLFFLFLFLAYAF